MKDDKDNKDDLIVDVDEAQLSLLEPKDDLIVETKPDTKPEEVKAEAEQKRERKRHNQDAIDALQAQLDAANRKAAELEQRRLEAEERARVREAEIEAAKGRVAQSEHDRVQGYIAAAKAKSESLKRDIVAAQESGDYGRAEDLRMEAAATAARLQQYQDAKVDLERNAARAKEERDAAPERPAPQQHVDPFEARISNLSRESQAWLRQHPECVTDEAQNAKVLWAHKDALKKGIRVDSREYFDHLEDLMGFASESEDGDEVDIETTPRDNRRTMPAAPVSRDTRQGQLPPGKYRLTREEADIAEQMGMTPAQYAKNKIEMQKKGLWNN